MNKGFEQTFLQRWYTSGQQAHVKLLNIINEMQIKPNPLHSHWMATLKSQIIKSKSEYAEKMELKYTVDGKATCLVTLENSLVVP